MTANKIGVLGFGAMGQAISQRARANGFEVVAWNRTAVSMENLSSESGSSESGSSESGTARPSEENGAPLVLVDDPQHVLEQSQLVFFALPAAALDDVIEKVGPFARGDHYWVHCCKGINAKGELAHEQMRRRTGAKQIGCLGGPIMARELAMRVPVGLVIASKYDCVIDSVNRALAKQGRFAHRTNDLIGVELAGAMRNVISVAAGMVGHLGEAARSAILARGLVETAKFGAQIGAAAATFVGMAGVGDLLARRASSTSRNYQVGERIAAGEDITTVLHDIGEYAEGVRTAQTIVKRARLAACPMPVAQGVVDVLDAKITCLDMIAQLLASDTGLGASDSLV